MTTENGNKAHGHGVIDINNFTPYPKNPIIAGVFKEIGWADELGSGIRNIKKYAKIYSGSVPTFIEGDIFKTIIKINEKEKIGEKKSAAKIGDKESNISIENKKIIIEYLKESPNSKTSQIALVLGLKTSRTRDYLSELIADNIIVAEGNSRNRTYRLK